MIIVNLSWEKYGYVTLTNVLEQWEKNSWVDWKGSSGNWKHLGYIMIYITRPSVSPIDIITAHPYVNRQISDVSTHTTALFSALRHVKWNSSPVRAPPSPPLPGSRPYSTAPSAHPLWHKPIRTRTASCPAVAANQDGRIFAVCTKSFF